MSTRGPSLAGSPGARLDQRICGMNDRYFSKRAANAFANRDLDTFRREQEVGRVTLAGVFAHQSPRAPVVGSLALTLRWYPDS